MQRFQSDALEHPRRRLIYDLVAAEPGMSFREVARRSGIAAGTTRHHLNKLHFCGLIEEQGYGMTRRFFTKQAFKPGWEHVVLMREPALRLLYDCVGANAGAPQKTFLELMEKEGWSRSTTQHRLSRLVDAGELTVRLHGRLKRYWAGTPPSILPTGRPVAAAQLA